MQREARRQAAAALIQRCWRAHRVAQADEWMRQFLANCLGACRALKQARCVARGSCCCAWRAMSCLFQGSHAFDRFRCAETADLPSCNILTRKLSSLVRMTCTARRTAAVQLQIRDEHDVV